MQSWAGRLLKAGALITLGFATAAAADTGGFKDSVDANGDGALSLDEFVMAMAERDYGRFDVNKDDRITIAEWTVAGGDFQTLTAERFNADSDDEMSAAELVEVYSWIFGNRDKDRNGALAPSETPPFLLKK
ncbi:hypothetical protein [Erythrobacter sp. F6033]|uniref:hypothetical protein n=1 Tax=Erythrobacter sp. F6033 TaxID=2926401 RepID=UPI001FF30E70|nr:hypothetical protein [Erythrobacter sp. F6033]MCK0129280.1 hypothetical protein [Erythrobacter sp. F6033]